MSLEKLDHDGVERVVAIARDHVTCAGGLNHFEVRNILAEMGVNRSINYHIIALGQ